MWFCQDDGHPDNHGYICCSACISWFVRRTGLGQSAWEKFYTPTDYRVYPKREWEESRLRSANFVIAEDQPRRVRRPVRRRLQSTARRRPRDLQSEAAAVPAPTAVASDDDMVITLTNQVFMEFVNTLNTHVRATLRSACADAGVDDATSARILARLDLSDEVLAHMFG